jgi:transketolase
MISVAAGLALAGKRVYVYAIASFLIQRALDQIKVDLCGMNLPVTLIGVGGGIGYSYDGFTHQIPQDIAILRSLPNIEIICPYDELTTRANVYCSETSKSPRYIRLEKGNWPSQLVQDELCGVQVFVAGGNPVVVTYGTLIHQVLPLAVSYTHLTLPTTR